MNFRDYIDLYLKWRKASAESISKRMEVEHEIWNVAVSLLGKLEGMFHKYGKEYVTQRGYFPNEGHFLDLDPKDILFHTVTLRYSKACVKITLSMELLDDTKFAALESQLREGRIKGLHAVMEDAKSDMDRAEREMYQAKKRYEAARREIESIEK